MPDANLTKKEFAHAIKTLMEDAPFGKISIGSVCATCGLSRKTFYYHFEDKYDLVNWIFYTEFVQLVQDEPPQDGWSLMRSLCRYLYKNRTFYINVLQVQGQNSFREYFGSFFSPLIAGAVDMPFEQAKQKAMYVSFLTDIFLIAIERWLCENLADADEFVDFFKACLLHTAAQVLQGAQ